MLRWWLADDAALSPLAREAIAEPDNLATVSAASTWEIAIKRSRGKLEAPDDLETQIEGNSFVALPITVGDSLAAGRSPRHHDDPIDRMLVAQAQRHGFTILTRDPRLSLYSVALLPG